LVITSVIDPSSDARHLATSLHQLCRSGSPPGGRRIATLGPLPVDHSVDSRILVSGRTCLCVGPHTSVRRNTPRKIVGAASRAS